MMSPIYGKTLFPSRSSYVFFFFKICTDIRLLANQKEIEEPFEKDQIGKSILTATSFLLFRTLMIGGNVTEWLGRFGFPDFQSLSTWLLLEWILQNMVRHFVTHKQVQVDKRHSI